MTKLLEQAFHRASKQLLPDLQNVLAREMLRYIPSDKTVSNKDLTFLLEKIAITLREIEKPEDKTKTMPDYNDPIFSIGKNPVDCGDRDAAENHDKYIYG